ncbi:MAG: hypothetical protein LBR65_06085 [Culturomica sp.]|jgi:hypothetical protein|nr:hypothetical protein [Culturomica sp.]
MNNYFNTLFNPFVRIAGYKAFLIGIVFLLLTAVVGNINQIYFPGILSTKSIPCLQLYHALIFQAIAVSVAVLIFYLLGLLFAKKVRFQDILGTVTLSRYPCLISAALGFLAQKDMAQLMEMLRSGNIAFTLSLRFWVFTLIAMLVCVWSLVLLYKAFKISTGLKQGVKLTWLFIAGVLLTEGISAVLIPLCLGGR